MLVVFILLTIIISTGCSLLGKRANGLILYGTDKQLNTAILKIKSDIFAQNKYMFKIDEQQDGSTIIINKTTAEALLRFNLLQVIVNKKLTNPIEKIPNIPSDGALIFAKIQKTETTVNGKVIKGIYGGNVVFGETRAYGKTIIVLDDAAWNKLDAFKLNMIIVQLNKDPTHLLKEIFSDVSCAQMVTIEKNRQA